MNPPTVFVKYHNILRQIVGCQEERVLLPDRATVPRLLRLLSDRHAGLRALLFLTDGSIAPHLVIFVNNRLIGAETLEITLCEGDEVMLFPAVSGG